MAGDDLITTSEACEILGGLDRSTISRWVQIGKITPVRRLRAGRGVFLFDRADIEALRDQLAAEREAAAS